jgi:hypothetical protein
VPRGLAGLLRRIFRHDLAQHVLGVLLDHARRQPFCDQTAQPFGFFLGGILIAADKIADLVAGAAVSPLGDAIVDPGLKRRRYGDIEL